MFLLGTGYHELACLVAALIELKPVYRTSLYYLFPARSTFENVAFSNRLIIENKTLIAPKVLITGSIKSKNWRW